MNPVCVLVFLIIQAHPALTSEIALPEILTRADSANKAEYESLMKNRYEYVEKAIFQKLGDDGSPENSDTVLSRVEMEGEKEISRILLYSSSTENAGRNKRSKKNERQESVGMRLEFSPENPNYEFTLQEETDSNYVISIKPRSAKPEKGQINGTYYIDKSSFLCRKADITIPRPEKLKEMAMQIQFDKRPDQPMVATSVKIDGHARALLGIVDIKFRISIERNEFRFSEITESK